MIIIEKEIPCFSLHGPTIKTWLYFVRRVLLCGYVPGGLVVVMILFISAGLEKLKFSG